MGRRYLASSLCLFRYFVQRFFHDLVLVRAGALAFTTLLSIVPLFIFIFYILSFFPSLQQAANKLEYFVASNFVASSAFRVTQQLDSFLANMRVLSWWNVIALAFFALLLLWGIVDAVNGVWRIKMRREALLSSIVYAVVLVIAPIAVSLLVLLGTELSVSPVFSKIEHLQWPSYLFVCVAEWLVFTIFHWMIPSCRVFWRYALIAGLITTVFFELAKWGFAVYIHHIPTYRVIYGALVSIPLFFMWIFLSWVIIIASALLCHIFQEDRKY